MGHPDSKHKKLPVRDFACGHFFGKFYSGFYGKNRYGYFERFCGACMFLIKNMAGTFFLSASVI